MLILLVPLLTACAQKVPDVGRVGQKLEYKGYSMTVTAIEEAKDFATTRAARSGFVLMAVEVLVESGLNKGVHFSPTHTKLVDGSGREYKPRTTGKEPLLKEVFDIAKGTSVRGWLTYEVPTAVRKLSFVNELPQDFKYEELVVRLTE